MRRAFALPLVLIIFLVVSTLVATVLWRQSAQTLSVQKQIDQYTGHHIAAGLREVISAWVGAVGNRPLTDAIDEDGLALILEPESGVSIEVYLREGQGALLSDLGGLTDESFQRARGMLAQLASLAPRRASELTRKFGPVAVSVNSGNEVTLMAAATSAVGDEAASLVGAILSARGDGKLTPEQFNDLLQKSSLTEEQRGKVAQVLTAQPIVWNILARTDSGPGQPAVVYKGVALVGAARDRQAGGLQRTSSVVSLERVWEPEEPGR